MPGKQEDSTVDTFDTRLVPFTFIDLELERFKTTLGEWALAFGDIENLSPVDEEVSALTLTTHHVEFLLNRLTALQKLENELLKSRLTKGQRILLGAMRHQRLMLRQLFDEYLE